MEFFDDPIIYLFVGLGGLLIGIGICILRQIRSLSLLNQVVLSQWGMQYRQTILGSSRARIESQFILLNPAKVWRIIQRCPQTPFEEMLKTPGICSVLPIAIFEMNIEQSWNPDTNVIDFSPNTPMTYGTLTLSPNLTNVQKKILWDISKPYLKNIPTCTLIRFYKSGKLSLGMRCSKEIMYRTIIGLISSRFLHAIVDTLVIERIRQTELKRTERMPLLDSNLATPKWQVKLAKDLGDLKIERRGYEECHCSCGKVYQLQMVGDGAAEVRAEHLGFSRGTISPTLPLEVGPMVCVSEEGGAEAAACGFV